MAMAFMGLLLLLLPLLLISGTKKGKSFSNEVFFCYSTMMYSIFSWVICNATKQ